MDNKQFGNQQQFPGGQGQQNFPQGQVYNQNQYGGYQGQGQGQQRFHPYKGS